MVVLALATGIAPSVWAAEDSRTLATALELLARRGGGGGEVVASG